VSEIETLALAGMITFVLAAFLVAWRASASVASAGAEAALVLDKPTSPEQASTFLRVAGRTIDSREWSPEVLEQVKKDYFRPAAAKQFISVLDVTSTCPKAHPNRNRVAVISKSATIARSISERLAFGRAEIFCEECGKKGKLTAQSEVWSGQFDTWDGAL